MAIDLLCPECGGVVGATEVTEAGRPCTCFRSEFPSRVPAPQPASTDQRRSPANVAPAAGASPPPAPPSDNGDPHAEAAGSTAADDSADPSADDTASTAAPAVPEKICCVCGKDVSKEKRLKDERGYWCVDCHKTDQEKRRLGHVECPDCGRLVLRGNMIEHDGRRICTRCHRHWKELEHEQKKYYNPVSSQHYTAVEKARITILLVIFTILALIIILSRIGLI